MWALLIGVGVLHTAIDEELREIWNKIIVENLNSGQISVIELQ